MDGQRPQSEPTSRRIDGAVIRSFCAATAPDFLRLINAHLAGWPYTRPVDAELTDYWQSLAPGAFQPQRLLVLYRDGHPQAVGHGQHTDQRLDLHLLAVAPGAVQDGVRLLRAIEDRCRAEGIVGIEGPGWRAGAFYGGYVLGCEPFLPHWARDAHDSFVRAGYRVGMNGVLMVRDLVRPVTVEPFPAGYDCDPQTDRREFGARAFGYHAAVRGRKAAHCYCRLYPKLPSPAGGPVGQIGNVTTDEPHRNRGLARVMVQMCLRDLQRLGAVECLVATGLDNAPALRAYENTGFERRHHLIWWTKQLTGAEDRA